MFHLGIGGNISALAKQILEWELGDAAKYANCVINYKAYEFLQKVGVFHCVERAVV